MLTLAANGFLCSSAFIGEGEHAPDRSPSPTPSPADDLNGYANKTKQNPYFSCNILLPPVYIHLADQSARLAPGQAGSLTSESSLPHRTAPPAPPPVLNFGLRILNWFVIGCFKFGASDPHVLAYPTLTILAQHQNRGVFTRIKGCLIPETGVFQGCFCPVLGVVFQPEPRRNFRPMPPA
jgi:hypothetical protein